MDQSQQHDMDGNGYLGSVTRPYYPTEVPKHDPMVIPSAHTHNGNHTGGHFPGEEVQPSLPLNQNHNLYLAISPGGSDEGYPYPGNLPFQGTPSGYQSAVWTLQQNGQPSSQDRRMSDPIQAEDERISHPRQRYSDPILQNSWNENWGPIESPGHMPAPFNGASNALYQASYNVCPTCRHYPHVDGDSVYQPDQRDISPTTKWGFRDANCYFPPPPEENVPSNQQGFTQTSRFTTSNNERFDTLSSELPNPGSALRVSAAVNATDIPVTVGVGNHSANKSLRKKRKRKPREIKPRKPRTLTVEGKAHAKAVRDFPGGACEYCKRKKTKARDPSITNLVSTRL